MGLSKATVLSLATGLLSFSGSVDAFWRLPCRSRTALARLDPLVDNGDISDHVHAIHGGGNLNMYTTASDLQSSDCTSCEVTQDKSAYWTPALYFMYPNGTSEVVPQVGGMLAYYLLYPDAADPSGNITAFPEGFQMMAGDKHQRNFTWPVPDPPKSEWSGDQVSQLALSQKALGFNCLNYAAAPEGSLYRHFLPDKSYLDSNCLDGIRLELMFPSCWNGKDVDSPNHKSHVAFPDLVMTGTCPEGYPVKLPSLFYETIWNTYAFAGIDGQFLISTGDPTGYSYHGDFMMGWEESFLQSAVDTCTNLSGEIQDCPLFDIQDDSIGAQCQLKLPEVLANENDETSNGLPVNVPIQSGPAYATDYPVYGANAATSFKPASVSSSVALVPTLTYSSATGSITDIINVVPVTFFRTETEAPSAAPSSASSTAESSASSTAASTVAPKKASSPSPAVTHPALLVDASSAVTVVGTTYITNGHEVVEMVIEQIEVTVTATSTASAKNRRHLNQHGLRHGARSI